LGSEIIYNNISNYADNMHNYDRLIVNYKKVDYTSPFSKLSTCANFDINPWVNNLDFTTQQKGELLIQLLNKYKLFIVLYYSIFS